MINNLNLVLYILSLILAHSAKISKVQTIPKLKKLPRPNPENQPRATTGQCHVGSAIDIPILPGLQDCPVQKDGNVMCYFEQVVFNMTWGCVPVLDSETDINNWCKPLFPGIEEKKCCTGDGCNNWTSVEKKRKMPENRLRKSGRN